MFKSLLKLKPKKPDGSVTLSYLSAMEQEVQKYDKSMTLLVAAVRLLEEKDRFKEKD